MRVLCSSIVCACMVVSLVLLVVIINYSILNPVRLSYSLEDIIKEKASDPSVTASVNAAGSYVTNKTCQIPKCSILKDQKFDRSSECRPCYTSEDESENGRGFEILPGASLRKKPPFFYKDLITFADYAANSRLSCPQMRYMGGHLLETGFRDGERAVCFAPNFNITPFDCLVYSFGIGDDWSFDDAMAGYGCEVFSFDPTTGLVNHNRSEHVHYYGIGGGGVDEVVTNNKLNFTLKTLSSIIDMLGHQNKTIDYLKIDIESYEVSMFQQLAEEPDVLQRIKQIGMEIHVGVKDFAVYYEIFVLLEYLGFSTFDARRASSQGQWYTTGSIPGLILSKAYEIAWAQVDNVNW